MGMRDKETAWRQLLTIVRIMRRHHIPYVLDGGTLLGFYREGWFFPHDKDIDITLLDQHKALDVIKKAARAKKFSVWRHQKVGTSGSKKLQLSRDGIMVDIVSKHQVGEDAVWALISDANTIKRMPARYYSQRAALLVRGEEFSIPRSAEAYLAARFGPDWRTPKRDWVPLRDDRAYS